MLENLSQAADSFKLKLDNHVFDSVKEAVSKFTEQERLFERCEVTLVDKAKEIDERERNFKDTAMVSSCLGQCESEIMKKLNQKDQVSFRGCHVRPSHLRLDSLKNQNFLNIL